VSQVRPPAGLPGQIVDPVPQQIRHEHVWAVRLPDGSDAVLAQLLPELAAEPALRRRWVGDVERVAALGAPALAPILAIGPDPDPRDPAAEPPWRLRAQPAGVTLESRLRAAPLPVDEALALVADLADAIHGVHAAGGVLRDLEPRTVLLAGEGAHPDRIWLTDVGLARLAILSSRTASSLMLESSPYAAPEHLRATVVDPRADLYTLGVILWRALTGTLPFGETPALLRRQHALPPLAEARPAVFASGAPDSGLGASLDRLLARCLAEDPEARPQSARELADALRGKETAALALARVTCQACGASLRAGLRLCLSCGKQAVQLRHVAADTDEGCSLYLRRASESEDFVVRLRDLFDGVAEEMPHLNFLVGDARMYSRAERNALHQLPARMFADLDPETAEKLRARLTAGKVKTRVVTTRRIRRSRRNNKAAMIGGGASAVAGVATLVAGFAALPGALLVFGGLLTATIGGISFASNKHLFRPPMARLRAAPAALPASDPLVARLGALLPLARSPDLAERVSELALLVQRLCDRRAADPGERGAPADALGPVDALVGLVDREVRALAAIDGELADLDEGAIVRALAASEARREPASRREPLLAGLDRLRGLEDRRAAGMQRLLEAASLLRRAVALELEAGQEPGRGDVRDAELALAMAALGND
jgi:protein kinase-like protein